MMPPETRFRRCLRVIENFFLAPASPRPIAALRIGLSLVLILQAIALRRSLLDFFAHDGLIQGDLTQYLSSSETPKLAWFVDKLAPFGLAETKIIYGAAWLYLASLVFLLVGLFTRPASVIAWFLHWTFMNTGYTTSYGVDLYAHVFLFYLMWMPAGGIWSMDRFISKGPTLATSGARLALRVLQLHLCISYLTSAIEKAKGIQWWNGELIWRALTLPVYQQFDAAWLANWPLLAKAAGWASLFLEMTYCIFIWPRRTRWAWIAGIVALHLGIAVFLGLDFFGVIMCVLTLTVFGFSADAAAQGIE